MIKTITKSGKPVTGMPDNNNNQPQFWMHNLTYTLVITYKKIILYLFCFFFITKLKRNGGTYVKWKHFLNNENNIIERIQFSLGETKQQHHLYEYKKNSIAHMFCFFQKKKLYYFTLNELTDIHSVYGNPWNIVKWNKLFVNWYLVTDSHTFMESSSLLIFVHSICIL